MIMVLILTVYIIISLVCHKINRLGRCSIDSWDFIGRPYQSIGFHRPVRYASISGIVTGMVWHLELIALIIYFNSITRCVIMCKTN